MRFCSAPLLVYLLVFATSITYANEPANFSTEDIEIPIGNNKIVGTLTLPDHQQNVPVILILPGMSGDRYGPPIKGTTKGLFQYVATGMAARGFASLSISPRGRGGSTGSYEDMTLERRIDEAVAAIEWIADQPTFSSKNISILGHSQGSLIAISAAIKNAKNHPVHSIILWAPQSNALSIYRRSMGEDVYQRGLNAKPDEVVSWFGSGGKRRAFKRGFFTGLKEIRTLDDIELYMGDLFIVTGERDRWSTYNSAQVFKHRHRGVTEIIELDVGHRMGAAIGISATTNVVNSTLEWLHNSDK